jgi:branched-chain amino acid transport system permease protein
MGGMVNAPAAVVGGLLLGVIEALTAGIFTSGIKEAVAFLVLFAVLLARTVEWRELLRRGR